MSTFNSFFDIEPQLSGLANIAQELSNQHEQVALNVARNIGGFDNIRSVLLESDRGIAAAELLRCESETASERIKKSFTEFTAPNELLNYARNGIASASQTLNQTFPLSDSVKESMNAFGKYYDEKQSLNHLADVYASSSLASAELLGNPLSVLADGLSGYYDGIHEQVKSVLYGLEDAHRQATSASILIEEFENSALRQAQAVALNVGQKVRSVIDTSGINFDSLMVECVSNPEFIDYYEKTKKSAANDQFFKVKQLREIDKQFEEQKVIKRKSKKPGLSIKQQLKAAKAQSKKDRRLAISLFLLSIPTGVLTAFVADAAITAYKTKPPKFAQMKQEMIMYSSCSMDLTDTVGKITVGESYRLDEQNDGCYKITFKTKTDSVVSGYIDPFKMKH